MRLSWDTDAPVHVAVFADTASRLDLETPKAMQNDRQPGHVPLLESQPVEVKFFAETSEHSVAVFDRPGGALAQELGDGVVGWLLMRQSAWLFDLGQHKFGPLETVPEEVKRWTGFDVLDGDVLILTNPADANTAYVVDTGSESGFLLNAAAWQQWKTRHSATPLTLGISFMANEEWVATEESESPEFDFAGISVHDVPVGEATRAHEDSLPELRRRVVVLGAAALQRLELVVDAPNKKAYARAAAPAPLDFRFSLFGVIFIPREHALVARVAKQSPAEVAGLRDGDVLTKIDDAEMDTVTKIRAHQDLFNLRQPAGTTRTFHVTRSGVPYHFSVRARDFIIPRRRTERWRATVEMSEPNIKSSGSPFPSRPSVKPFVQRAHRCEEAC